MSQRTRIEAVGTVVVALAVGLCFAGCSETVEPVDPAVADKIPITTTSETARELFLEGRRLAEMIRFTDARDYFLQALDEDPKFAMAYLYLATNSASAKEFFSALQKAVFLAGEVSEGEKLWILAQDAGNRGKPEQQLQYLDALVELYPRDERAHNLLAQYYFGRQEYDQAIEHYESATAINPEFSPVYNQLGYALRSLREYEAAEEAFKKYIELIPDEPNPYDSYAELLMRVGRHDESIEVYRKALEKNPQFVPSFVGIGNNQMFLNEHDAARSTFAELHEAARHGGERRVAHFWIAMSYVFENDLEKAVAAVEEMMAIAAADDDKAAMAGDRVLTGTIRLNLGSPAAALADFEAAVRLAEQADVNDDVKAGARRNLLYQQARVEIAIGDLERAERKAGEFRAAAQGPGIANEIRRSHELFGLIALARGDSSAALRELLQANSQNPAVIYWLAKAHLEAGESERARELAREAAYFNQLTPNFAYIRNAALDLLNSLSTG